jgi:hypothetical protein
MSDTPETHEAVERWRQGKINIFDEMARLERERNAARRELQLLLESTKVETCSEPLPERDGEPADFSGAITRMRLAEAERDQWRECSVKLADALWKAIRNELHVNSPTYRALSEFEKLNGETR